ncbi:DUF3089 domain-containing protein [Mangrovimicrobium sediminis]|uniref:DUF3089 domain-containing protein n=1 Tax=Mangrovimicrobium sediminis TaxID=2562682 RepID=A0A4Z0M573_9GAMM|nr:DUF3089 domain-containing protein [Haliea sp. SAOS-164]TGD74577.1 DUF3089 domain-containing protein [Haliea sp. SAOS-164]
MKKLLAVLALAGLGVGGSAWSVLQVWGEELVVYYIEPDQPFDVANAGRAPDYNDSRYWAAYPGKPSAARLVPQGLAPRESRAPADVFYIHPTSYISGEAWNAPLFVESRAWEMVDVILGAQASAFNLCCEVYAPHYRQATLWSFLDREDGDGTAALELAYSDIARAFEVFLARNDGRPFIVASHSQGTYHALRLLAEYVDGQPAQQRLAAAYLIGYWVPLDTFGRTLVHIQPCETARDTGCVVHWSTYGERGERRAGVPHWYPGGVELSDGKPLLCTNPLNWQRAGGRVAAVHNPGALYVSPGGNLLNTLLDTPVDIELRALPPLLEHWTWAECRDGLLYVADQEAGPFAEADPAGQDYHLIDYSLFYGALRNNAPQRVGSLRQQRLAASAAPLSPSG